MKFIRELKMNYQTYILCLLIISGPIKPMLNAFVISLDITLIAFFIAAFDVVFQISKKNDFRNFNKVAFFYFGVLILLFLLMLLSLFYSSSNVYSKEKLSKFTLTLFCFLYPFFIKKINWRSFFKMIILIAIPLSLLFIYYKQFYWSIANANNRSFSDRFYDVAGSYMGLGYILSLAGFIFVERKKWLLLIGIYLLLLALGARGPLIFSLLTILVVKYKMFLSIKFKPKRVLTLISALTILISVVIVKYNFLKENFYKYGLDRFISLFSPDRNDASASGRVELMSFAIEKIFTNPWTFIFGNGIGSFGYDYLGMDVKENPHNIFLETWYELGIFGLFLIVIFLVTPFFVNKRLTLYKMFILFAFFNCLKSNNLSGIWILVILYSMYLNNIKIFPKIDEVRFR